MLSTALLTGAPIADVVLLVATVADLSGGGIAEPSHGLAAAYIGFSVAFGHPVIRWADARFAHRFAGGLAPTRPPKYGAGRARHEWRVFGRAALAWEVACGLLVAVALVGDSTRTAALSAWITQLTLVLGIWGLVALTYTVFPKHEKASVDGRGSTRVPPERC